MTRPRLARILAASLAAAALPVALAPPTPASAREPQLDQAVAALRAITTLRADFVQTDRDGRQLSGVVTLKRPGRIRFQYQKDVPLLIVSDGAALTLIDYEVGQVQRWPIRNSPLGALLDPTRDVAAFGRLQPTGAPDVISIEVRDRAHAEYGVLTLVFTRRAGAPEGLELTGWVALDAQNRRTTVRLANQRYGVEVPDATFRWRDPRPTFRR